ncbi:MAG TPA: tRNA epoxyqueuosine(34) reductase QueG [Gemmatimonadales bacterium]|jgi:epoxyqueuosine reductase|nr:tRNA epoxyqueuosine(34) reductase QueG [Gemmatimonadales bacterium]
MSPTESIKTRALELGFMACGITHPGPTAHGDRLDDWLARGYAGTMRYLHRQARRRKDPRLILPQARSVVVVLDNYYTAEEEIEPRPPRIAKYARGEDYHRVTRRRLELLAGFIRELGAELSHSFTDAGPVPERELAQRAGLGWIGKNTMLVRPEAGSFFFIGSVFTDLALELDQPFDLDRCGSCTRCLDACPTGALVEPRLLDATRCISYLTIEQRGPIPDELADRFQGYVFGCDICNDVCPWNQRFSQATLIPEFQSRRRLDEAGPGFFEEMTEAGFDREFGDTPLERAGLDGMRRNMRAAFRSASYQPEHR